MVDLPRTRYIDVDPKNLHKIYTDMRTHRGARSVGLLHFKTAAGPEIGTGTLLRHANRLYVLTCDHVAKAFLKDASAEIIFRGRTKLRRDQLRPFRHDARDDIALLHVYSPGLLRRDYFQPLDLRDLRHEADFRRAHGTPCFVLFGFPAETVERKGDATLAYSMTYLTVPDPKKQSTKLQLMIDYPVDTEFSPELPEPGGLSGSLIFECTQTPKGQLWVPPRAIALQFKGSTKRIRGTTLRRVFAWLSTPQYSDPGHRQTRPRF